MLIDGHYDPDPDADIAWLRFAGYDPETVVGEQTDAGLREIDPSNGRVVGLEYWHASTALPRELLTLLRPPASAQPPDRPSGQHQQRPDRRLVFATPSALHFATAVLREVCGTAGRQGLFWC